MSSSRRSRPQSRLVAPCSPTASRVPPHACRRRPRRSAFVATTYLSRFLQRSSIGRRSSRSHDIGNGREPRLRPSMSWRFLVDIRTCSPAATPTVRQRATVAMPNGSSKPSGIMIPKTCSTPPSRCRLLGTACAPALLRMLARRVRRRTREVSPYRSQSKGRSSVVESRRGRCSYLCSNGPQSSRLPRSRALVTSSRRLPWMSEDTPPARSMRKVPSPPKSICRPKSNPAPLNTVAEADRPHLVDQPGMRHKYLPLRHDPATGAISSYPFRHYEDATKYRDFLEAKVFPSEQTTFWKRPFFFNTVRFAWCVTGAHDLAPITTHDLNRFAHLDAARTLHDELTDPAIAAEG